MCEHNLVIGESRELIGGSNTCLNCKTAHPIATMQVIYVGDHVIGYHHFFLKIPYICLGCGAKIVDVHVKCGVGGPIDVTQEFLLLPVRSRE